MAPAVSCSLPECSAHGSGCQATGSPCAPPRARWRAGALLGLLAATACGDRDPVWDEPLVSGGDPVGLTGSAAVIDPGLDRALMLTSAAAGQLGVTPLRVGRNVASVATTPDRSRLLVLSRGVSPRRNPEDELPSLTVIDGGPAPSVLARFELSDPLTGLAVDPLGEWVVVYAADGVVENPNELIFVDLRAPEQAPVPRTLRSRGGRPVRLSFTQALAVPRGEPRRFLVVETDRDVTFLGLDDLARSEITVELPRTPTGATGRPSGVAWHDGDPADPTDARLAVGLQNDTSVVILQLGPEVGDNPEQDFQTTVNVADVGGQASALEFVQTDGGLRLAALVPAQQRAALVEPLTAVVEQVPLGGAYSSLARITADLATPPDQSDVALLFGEGTRGVAFWSLGRTTGTPYRAVENLTLPVSVTNLLAVPGSAHGHLKIMETGQGEFYVFDLETRTGYPLLAESSGFDISVSPDGDRAWAVLPGTARFASVRLDDLHPTSLEAERAVAAVADIERADGGRSALALHLTPVAGGDALGLGVTLLDAREPDTARSRFFAGLGLEGLP